MQYPQRFMLMVSKVAPGQDSKIAAVSNVGTGRLQTVRKEWNPLYYEVTRKFGEATGVPVLLNTSFNLVAEPIVTTPANAHGTYSNSDIDYLILDNFILSK